MPAPRFVLRNPGKIEERREPPAVPISAPVPVDDGSAPRSALATAMPDEGAVKYAVSLRDRALSARNIGGDFYRHLINEDRGEYLSYAGGVQDCTEDQRRRRSSKAWYPTGSVKFEVEVMGDRLFIRSAARLPQEERPDAPDEDFWDCYGKAVVKMGFLCRDCKQGRHELLWRLRTGVYREGDRLRGDFRTTSTENDDVFFTTP